MHLILSFKNTFKDAFYDLYCNALTKAFVSGINDIVRNVEDLLVLKS